MKTMNSQISILVFGLSLLFNQVCGQTFKQQYNDIVSKNDTVGQLLLLAKWEKADNNDPELYVAYFNYYINKSKKEIIELGYNPKGEGVLQIMDMDTTKKAPVAYMYGNIYYDPGLLKKGFEYADIGIAKNPSRLDIRFGKTYMLGELENWKDFTAEIIKTIDYSVTINNKWTWTDNEPVEDSIQFMLSSIQDYQLQLYNTNNDDLLDNMKQIAEEILKYYPDHVESLSNLSIVYLIKKEFDKGLEALLKAEKLAPTDYIVLNNIAQAYKLKGDNKNAIKYYELTMKYGDDEVKKYAKEQIEELKRK
jgi:tetratricopeptide (TPR) repeat protein